MLNKNANYYNIEKNFKNSTVISKFSENISIFETLSIDIWQLKFQQRQTNKTKKKQTFIGKLFRINKFFFVNLLREDTLESKLALTNRNSLAFLLYNSNTFYNVDLFSIFSQTFLELIFATKLKQCCWNNQLFVYQLSKKYCVYYVSEHLKYCSQINEYWLRLNKNGSLNIILRFTTLRVRTIDKSTQLFYFYFSKRYVTFK